ncbi:unnamed protein product [Rotaria sordida]|uniref:Uncharacterized protein n=1 Tax=Rotaria sordida TaxID=392033 RepID=A0A815CZC4_9BILA|nr:unnamed protein product [Rotaria sordida]CAF1043001.1 unnamed protein product [Rotaria sordida]CAF1267346.1 unnamed protein product [Rotaria sordida]CAF1290692.1 unnamed protein product [Rotaria sordida]CAF1295438.1 unnamed protein product [Rotaria sordida]
MRLDNQKYCPKLLSNTKGEALFLRALLPKPSGFLNTFARFQYFLNFLGHLVHLASTRHRNLTAEQLSLLSYYFDTSY